MQRQRGDRDKDNRRVAWRAGLRYNACVFGRKRNREAHSRAKQPHTSIGFAPVCRNRIPYGAVNVLRSRRILTRLCVEPLEQAQQLLPLVRAAVNSEIDRLELALKLARERLLPFERKYGVSSKRFIEEMTAEDLQGGDDEYVQWAGEYRLMQRLEERLVRLQEVENSD